VIDGKLDCLIGPPQKLDAKVGRSVRLPLNEQDAVVLPPAAVAEWAQYVCR
jgi:hypothetical protein